MTDPTETIRARIAFHERRDREIDALVAQECAKVFDWRVSNELRLLEREKTKCHFLLQELRQLLPVGAGDAAQPAPAGSSVNLFADTSRYFPEYISGRTVGILPTGGIGDAILHTPALRALKQQHPNTRFELYFYNERQHAVFLHNPHITLKRLPLYYRVFPKRIFGKTRHAIRRFGNLGPAGLHELQGTRLSELIARSLGVEISDPTPELFLTSNELSRARERLQDLPRPWVALNVSSVSSQLKVWNQERWSELVRERGDCSFIQLGVPTDPKISGARCWHLPLRQSFAVLANCDSFIGLDSGLTHAAAALKRRGVVLYGPTSPGFWGHPSLINLWTRETCSPCLHVLRHSACPYQAKCMSGISVAMVSEALDRSLDAENLTSSLSVRRRGEAPAPTSLPKLHV